MSERKIKLQIKDMTKKYDNGDGVEHINLDIYEGEIVTFLGPSGCGKTTILRTIGGFLDVTSGDITIDGQSIIGLPPEKRPTAMVFQSYNLWPHMTIYENLAFGLKLRKVPKAEIDADIKKMLALVSMSGCEKKYPNQMSGGQQQRIAIARSLLLKPSAAPARRAVLRARREDPSADARGAQEDPERPRHHGRIRNPRSGGGHVPLPPHRRYEQGQVRADRHPDRDLRQTGHPSRRLLHRRDELHRQGRQDHRRPSGGRHRFPRRLGRLHRHGSAPSSSSATT